MNKDLFKVESDEIKRILSLHEERSKNQYLDIISEQTKVVYNKVQSPQYKTQKPQQLGDEGWIPAGTVFKPKDKKTLVALGVQLAQFQTVNAADTKPSTVGGGYSQSKKQPKKINIYYNCRNRNFTIQGKGNQSYGSSTELEGNLYKNLCGKTPPQPLTNLDGTKVDAKKLEQDSLKSLNAVHLIQRPHTIGTVKLQKNDYVQKGKVSGILNIISNGQKILSFNCANKTFFLGDKTMTDTDKQMTTTLSKFCPSSGGNFKFDVLHTIGGNYTVGNVEVKNGDTVIKSGKGGVYKNALGIMNNGKVVTYFFCDSGVYSGNAVESGDKKYLTTKLKTLCTSDTNKSQIKDLGSSLDGGSGTDDGSGTGGQKQRTSQTATITKQIQTSLGTKTPTGKITDAELDAILAKLG